MPIARLGAIFFFLKGLEAFTELKKGNQSQKVWKITGLAASRVFNGVYYLTPTNIVEYCNSSRNSGRFVLYKWASNIKFTL
jgi:hypothetical protein